MNKYFEEAKKELEDAQYEFPASEAATLLLVKATLAVAMELSNLNDHFEKVADDREIDLERDEIKERNRPGKE